jgi:hypothetical protein
MIKKFQKIRTPGRLGVQELHDERLGLLNALLAIPTHTNVRIYGEKIV